MFPVNLNETVEYQRERRPTHDERQHCIDAVEFDALSEALDALDDLPDDRPGYVMHGPAKAEWALMGANAEITGGRKEE